jgi:Transmembrane domain of unknown function (DUF3566)
MTWEIRRIPLLSLVKVSFVVYLFLSLVIMLLYGLFIGSMAGMLGALIAEDFDIAPLTGGALIIGGLIGSVILACIYTFFTFIGGLIYNAVASLVGGLEVELEARDVSAGYSDIEQPISALAPTPLVQHVVHTTPPQQPSPAQEFEQQSPAGNQEEISDESGDQKDEHERFRPSSGTPDKPSEGWGWGSGDQKPKE